MYSYKAHLNKLSQNTSVLRHLTEEEEKALKSQLMNMLVDFISLCDKYELTWMLGGGTCLGAIRHQGFIPWDDDLDLNMPRKDIEQLKLLLEKGELGPDYEYTCPNSGKDAPSMFLKIYKKGTKMVEIGQEFSNYPKGIFLDVFILDGVPEAVLLRKVKGAVANLLRLIGNVVLEARNPLGEVEKTFFRSDRRLHCVVMFRRFLGHVFGVIPHRFWIDTFDTFVKDPSTEKGFVTFPTGRKMYEGELLPASVFFPVRKVLFEGVDVNIPGRAEVYLENLYGEDYMQIPPIEKRERHFIVDFGLSNVSLQNE